MLGTLTKDSDKVEAAVEKPATPVVRTPVVKIIEVIATSEKSFDDAIASGVREAAGSLRNITGGDVKHMTLAVKDGKISEYRVDLKIAFALEDDEEEDEED